MQNGIMLNIDINSVVTPFLNSVAEKPTPVEADLYALMDAYNHTAVTDIALCCFCQLSATPSRVFTDSLHKARQKMENGEKVDYSRQYGAICRLYEECGLDVYAVWLKRIRQNGMRAWLSVRMNDSHDPDAHADFLRSDFFYEAKKNGLMLGDEYGYFRNCLRYDREEVREKMLAYIRELVSGYSMDGLELDFMREPLLLRRQEAESGRALITDFVRKVRAITQGAGIALAARVPRDPQTCLAYGMDAVGWAREGLVDILIPTARWASSDSHLPVSEWKAAAPARVYAGVETLINWRCREKPVSNATAEVNRGYARAFFAQGADKLYLYNHFVPPREHTRAYQERYGEYLRTHETCGSLSACEKEKRRLVFTNQDHAPDWYEPERRMPLRLTAQRAAPLPLPGGACEKGESAELIIGMENGRPFPRVFCGETEIFGKDEANTCFYGKTDWRYRRYPLKDAAAARFLSETDEALMYLELSFNKKN